MTYDPKLVEAVRDAITEWPQSQPMEQALAALTAIDASGTHCVLPIGAKEMWYRAAHKAQFFDGRDACLAARPEKDGE